MGFLFSFEGRINRQKYWMFALGVFIAAIIAIVVDMSIGTYNEEIGIGIVSGVLQLLLIWPGIAIGAKRLHDRNQSGWMQLLVLIPLLGALYLLIVMGFLKGTDGPNKFGSDPLGGTGADAA